MPRVDSLAELNALLDSYDSRDDSRRIANRAQTVGHDFVVEQPALRPLPGEAFEAWVTLTPRVDRYARISVRQCQYSVPARLIGQRVRVLLRADRLLVFDGRRHVAEHERATVRGAQTLLLDHYLEDHDAQGHVAEPQPLVVSGARITQKSVAPTGRRAVMREVGRRPRARRNGCGRAWSG